MKPKVRSEPALTPASVANRPEDSYAPTVGELAASQRFVDRSKREPQSPRFKVAYSGDNKATIEAAHIEPACTFAQLADMACTSDLVFSEGLMHQLADVSRTGRQLTSRELNFMLATVCAISPRDSTEALLATQMAAIHNATMAAARRLNHVQTIDQQDSASNMLNRLARTFAGQIEALKRYRADGEQRVTVQHQHISLNANQAVVGISQRGGGAHETESQSHAIRAAAGPSALNARSPALLGHEQAQPMPLRSPGREGSSRVPNARRESRRAEGNGQRRMATRDGDQ